MFPVWMSADALAIDLGIGLDGMVAGQPEAREAQGKSGSTGFCLYDLPGEGKGKRRSINLAIVQCVKTRRDKPESFGGGNLGSAYDAVIPASSPDEASARLQKMTDRTKACH